MIIDTEKIEDKLLEAYAYLITKNLRPVKNDKWNAFPCIEEQEIEYSKVFEDNKCIVNFGDVGNNFRLVHNREADSLKGLPEKCEVFEISGLKIKDVDHLPYSESYLLSNCDIEKFSVPFPNNTVDLLYVDNNKFKNFKGFPKEVNILSMSSNPNIKSLKSIPAVSEQVHIGYCKNLSDISDLKGDYDYLDLRDINIESLPKLSKNVRNIYISGCNKLFDISSLLDDHITSYVDLVIDGCDNLDFFTLCKFTQCKTKANMKINSSKGSYDHFKEVYSGLYDKNLSRLEFEEKLFHYWYEKDRLIWENLPFATKEFSERRDNICASNKSVSKFSL